MFVAKEEQGGDAEIGGYNGSVGCCWSGRRGEGGLPGRKV